MEMQGITLGQVITKRQAQLLDIKLQLEAELARMRDRTQEIHRELTEIYLENEAWEQTHGRGKFAMVGDSVPDFSRKLPSDRIMIEDAIRLIMDQAGRPMSIGEIRKQLEFYDWQWVNYHTAYSHITSSDILEHAGRRGYYQLHRSRF